MPYVQKTLEEATFEHNKNQPWNFKDLFKRKNYVYLQRDKTAKSCFVYGKYNHTASTCFYYLQQQRNLKQHAFEKTKKNKKVRSYEARSTQFRKSISPPRQIATVKPPKAKQSCIICGESCHFAANCKFNPFNQFSQSSSLASTVNFIPNIQKPIYRRTPIEKPIFNRKVKKEKSLIVEPAIPSAATKTTADHKRPKKIKNNPKPSAATKSAAGQFKPSTATKFAADQSKPRNIKNQTELSAVKATSAADNINRAAIMIQQWQAKSKSPSS
ncbi:hypothetical protein L1987_02074 [Smallanthus sonchifolius]|uniref:Uncharacterized protein n=1 Tax=Smallanthus sonchifolius TaxID=185202 RepID=A0ACB9K6Q9_9ASTR|nr:hypothetical protein L1987_02074 [Smallanthus sonchifolius]